MLRWPAVGQTRRDSSAVRTAVAMSIAYLKTLRAA